MFKKILILLLLLTTHSMAYAISNCLEEVQSNIASLTNTEKLTHNYFSTDISDYDNEDFFNTYYQRNIDIFDSIPTIETLCPYSNTDFKPIANGLIAGKYYVIFKGLIESDSSKYRIDMVIYDPQTLRKQIVELESFIVGEGLLFTTTSEFKDGGLYYSSFNLGFVTTSEELTKQSRLHLNDTDYHEDKDTGILVRCLYLGIAKTDDVYDFYKKDDPIYDCSEKRTGYISLEKIFASKIDWDFDAFSSTETYKDPISRFNSYEIDFDSRDIFDTQSKHYLSDFLIYDSLRGSPFFHEGTIDNIVEHYATKSIILSKATWLGTYTYQNDDNDVPYSETLEVKSNSVSFKKSNSDSSSKYQCDDNYQAHFHYDLLVLEYQGDDIKCGYQDNRFIIIKYGDHKDFDIILRGAHSDHTGWNKLKRL